MARISFHSFRRLLAGHPTTFAVPSPAVPQYDRLQLWHNAFPVVTLATRSTPSTPLLVDTRVTHGARAPARPTWKGVALAAVL